MPEDIIGLIREHLRSRGVTHEVTGETRWVDTGLDSLDALELTVMLEERLGVEISEADIGDVEVVGDFVRIVERACGLP